MAGPPDHPAQAAEAYAALGWRVLPIAPGQKHPEGLGQWQNAATDQLDVIRGWWSGRYQGYGVGLLCGPDTGFWVLDVDVSNGKPGADTLNELVDANEPLPDTVLARTGSGGLHFLFAWDPARPVTNGLSVHLGPGLDIRGAGGQIVAAPTLHPCGQQYQWLRDPWAHAIAPAPDWLYQLIHPPAAGIQLAQTSRGPALDPAGDSIAEWVTSQHDWHTELERDGWTLHSHKPGGDTWWTRPGKDRREGHSAVLHEPDGPLVIFTTEVSLGQQRAGTPTNDGGGISLSLFGYLAARDTGGDRSALARAARIEHTTRHQPPAAAGAAAPHLAVVPDPDPPPAGFVDLADWWDGDHEQRQADVLHRTDGAGLLYIDQLNWIYGDSGSGKTWVALAAAVELLSTGHHVAWIHYEDPTPITVLARLKQLGVDRAAALDRFHYYDPQGEGLDWGLVTDLCAQHDVALVVLDSIGEALNACGVDEDRDNEVGPWINAGPRRMVNTGIGFVGVDHGTKASTSSAKAPGRWHPSGSKRKRAAVTGTCLLVEAIEAPTAASDGTLRLSPAKDRHGTHRQGQTAGIMVLRHDALGGLTVAVHPPADHSIGGDSGGGFGDTSVRDAVRQVVKNPGYSKSQIITLMPTAGKGKWLTAINSAIEAELIRAEPGPRQAQLLYPMKAVDDDELF